MAWRYGDWINLTYVEPSHFEEIKKLAKEEKDGELLDKLFNLEDNSVMHLIEFSPRIKMVYDLFVKHTSLKTTTIGQMKSFVGSLNSLLVALYTDPNYNPEQKELLVYLESFKKKFEDKLNNINLSDDIVLHIEYED